MGLQEEVVETSEAKKPEIATIEAHDMAADDAQADQNLEPMSLMDEFKDMLATVAIALVCVMILRTFLFQPFTIPSASMEPNLYEGDYIFVSKWDYGYSKHSILFSPPVIEGRVFDTPATRGDIVVFKLPRDNKTDYIKRIIGLPGDTVQMRRNKLYINNQAVAITPIREVEAENVYGSTKATIIEEALPDNKVHLMQDMVPDSTADDTEVFSVPEGYYFVMGDNRDNSLDSRFAADVGVGFVPKDNLEGKARLILMSWKPGSSLWKPWTWLNFRWDRFLKPLK
jgi:signal peptidase I